jgi:hypothetical protein
MSLARTVRQELRGGVYFVLCPHPGQHFIKIGLYTKN